jgi:hypothetical protein
MTGSRFRLVSGPHGWDWVLTGTSGDDVLGTSAAPHPTVSSCRHNIALVQDAPLSRLCVTGSDGTGWRWELLDDTGRPLARSVVSYPDSRDCREWMMRFRRSAVHAAPPAGSAPAVLTRRGGPVP